MNETLNEALRSACFEVGIVYRDVPIDGLWHKTDIAGDPKGQGDGRIKLFRDDEGGIVCNWKGEQRAFFAKDVRNLSEAERRQCIEKRREAIRQSEAAEALRHTEAAKKATVIWEQAAPAPDDHPYLVAKRVSAHGLRVYKDALVVRVSDETGELHSLQFIAPDSTKKFLTGGRVGGCYFCLGSTEGAAAICICEGFATGASVHEATGLPVAVAFNAGNLFAVSNAMRKRFAEIPLIFCADDDAATEGNPGVTKATAAARAVGGLVAIPDFGAERPENATDFNDLQRSAGIDAIRVCIESARATTEFDERATHDVNADDRVSGPGSAEARSPVAGSGEECSFASGRFKLEKHGVVYIKKDGAGDEAATPKWICSALNIVALTRDARSKEWGRLLEWKDADGIRHQWAMPLELLQGDGVDVRRELARLGLMIAPGREARDLLASYLLVWPVKPRARCVERLGWQDKVYVTPAESIGEAGERIVFQNAHALEPEFCKLVVA